MIMAFFSFVFAASPDHAGGAVLARVDVSSAAFAADGNIPAAHTCEGADRSPPLTWSPGPDGTRTFALVVDDPDAPAGTWTHWLAWNIPADARGLPAAVKPDDPSLVQGRNDFRRAGWGGPCPPKGHGPHRYRFHVYALDTSLNLKPGASRAELERAMAGHVLGRGDLTGIYERKR